MRCGYRPEIIQLRRAPGEHGPHGLAGQVGDGPVGVRGQLAHDRHPVVDQAGVEPEPGQRLAGQ
jgi:hypothetical protein